MKIRVKLFGWVLPLALGLGGGAVTQALAAPYFQDHHEDYSKNKVYKQGMRDGQKDRDHHRDHSKKRHFKKDEDQRAYDAGYESGHGR
jgi:hypothetical protein